MRLAGAGRDVVILEREQRPGGRAGRIEADGFSFDTGPTVPTMPDLIDDAFAALGEDYGTGWTSSPGSGLSCVLPDGSTGRFRRPRAGWRRRSRARSARLRRLDTGGFRRLRGDHVPTGDPRLHPDRNLDSPLDLMSPNLLRLIAKGGLGRLQPRVNSFLKDPPHTATVLLPGHVRGSVAVQGSGAVLGHLVHGLGRRRLSAQGRHARASTSDGRRGGQARRDDPLRRDGGLRGETVGDRATAVTTTDGTRFPADAVVLNPDLPIAYRDLLGLDGSRLERLDYSPSCWLMLAGSSASYSKIAHHNIHFWARVAAFVRRGAVREPHVRPQFPGHESEPFRPVLGTGGQTELLRAVHHTQHPRQRLLAECTVPGQRPADHGGTVTSASPTPSNSRTSTTPADWQARGMEAGAPLQRCALVVPDRAVPVPNHWGANVVFTGSGTQPGVGVPMVLVSGRLAAERITGVDPAYRSAAWR